MPLKILQRLRNTPERPTRGSVSREDEQREFGDYVQRERDSNEVSSPRNHSFSVIHGQQVPRSPRQHARSITPADGDADSSSHGHKDSSLFQRPTVLNSKKSLPFLRQGKKHSLERESGRSSHSSQRAPPSPISPPKTLPPVKTVRHAFDGGDRIDLFSTPRVGYRDDSSNQSASTSPSSSTCFPPSASPRIGTAAMSGARLKGQVDSHRTQFKDLSGQFANISNQQTPLLQHQHWMPEPARASPGRNTPDRRIRHSGDEQEGTSTRQLLKQSPRRFQRPTTACSVADLQQQADLDVRRIAVHLSPPPVGLEASAFEERVDLIKGLEGCYAGDQRRKSGQLCLEPGVVIEKIELFMQALLTRMYRQGEVDGKGMEELDLSLAFSHARQYCGLPQHMTRFDLVTTLRDAMPVDAVRTGTSHPASGAAMEVLVPASFGSAGRQSQESFGQHSQSHSASPRATFSSRPVSRGSKANRPGTGGSTMDSTASSAVHGFGADTSAPGHGFAGHSLTPAPRRRGGSRRPTTAPESVRSGSQNLSSSVMTASTDTYTARTKGHRLTIVPSQAVSADRSQAMQESPRVDGVSSSSPPSTPPRRARVSEVCSLSPLTIKKAVSKKSSALSMVRELTYTHDAGRQLDAGTEKQSHEFGYDRSQTLQDAGDAEEHHRTSMASHWTRDQNGTFYPSGKRALQTSVAFSPRHEENSEVHSLAGTSPASSTAATPSTVWSSIHATPDAFFGGEAVPRLSDKGLSNPTEAGKFKSPDVAAEHFGLGIEVRNSQIC